MRTTVSLDDALAAYVDAEFAHEDISDAEAVRRAIERAQTCDERVHELEQRVEQLETDLERARREKRQILDQREEHTELVRAVEEERSLAERRAAAGVATRAKWWLFGMDDGE